MATWAGAKALVTPSDRWEFPAIDNQTEPDQLQSPDVPHRAPRRWRIGVSAALGIAVVGVALAAWGVVWNGRTDTVEVVSEESSGDTAVVAQAPAPVVIHVSGAVASPGLVTLEEGARVIDAVDAAGGATAQSAVHQLNLARPVIDGERIVVPREGEEVSAGSSDGPISLSRSDATQLQELPGVGPAIAERIIAWREENGPFRVLEDVLAVSGIGEATLERLQGVAVP